MKRDARQEWCLFLSCQLEKRHHFWKASLFIFGPSYFVRALRPFGKRLIFELVSRVNARGYTLSTSLTLINFIVKANSHRRVNWIIILNRNLRVTVLAFLSKRYLTYACVANTFELGNCISQTQINLAPFDTASYLISVI